MISVIIPTCNRNELLSKCLENLKPSVQGIPENSYEVVVTDDSKNNLAFNLVQTEYSWAKWFEGPKKGPAANRNNGAKYAKGEWLIFIDDDCLPDGNLIHAYKIAIKKHQNIKVFEGCIKASRNKESFIEEAPININGGYLWSCNFMISANLFKKLKGFDQAFPYPAMEDVDLQYRIKKANEKIEFIGNAYVIHPWRIEKNIVAKNKERFESILYLIKKHPDIKSRINAKYFFKSSVINFKNAFKYAYRFKFKGLGKQFVVSILHLYFGLFLLIKS